MTDTRTPEQRRRIMKSVGTSHTGPEIEVRKTLHALGYRYRLHSSNLPGRPDIVFPGRKKAVFVHGCFWHYHGCVKGLPPKSNLEYWLPKLDANRERDYRNVERLEEMGWSVMTIWQCELGDRDRLIDKLESFLRVKASTKARHTVA